MPSPGTDMVVSILGHALRSAHGVVPLRVEVRELDTTLRLVVQPDGSVTADVGGIMTRTMMRWLRPARTLRTAPSGSALQSDARDVLQRMCERVGPKDWEAVTTHAFERSTLRGEARSMGVSASAYTDALTRVRGIAATGTEGTVR